MKLSLFKNVRGKPSPITAVSSNNSTIVVFRGDNTVELVDSLTLLSYVVMEFGYRVTTSAFLTSDTVVCGSECGCLVFLDIKTLAATSSYVGHRPVQIAAGASLFSSKWDVFYYSADDSNVYERRQTETTLVHRNSSVVTSILVVGPGSLVMGDACGKVKVLLEGRITCELSICTQKINMMCPVTGSRYIGVCEDGSFSYFDIEMGVVLQRTVVRSSALNVCAYVCDKVHLSGADSRIIAFSRSGDKFIKSYQIDTHYASVMDMEVDNGRILTGGEDTILSVVWPTDNKYLGNKIFHRPVELGASKVHNEFYINNLDSIDFYSFDMLRKETVDEESGQENRANGMVSGGGREEDTRKTTFGLSEASVGRMGYARQKYRHTLRICVDGRIYCSSATPGFSHIAYSNSKETRVMVLCGTGGPRIDEDLKLEAANRLVLTEDLILLQGYRYEVSMIDIATRQTVGRIGFEDHREKVYCVGGLVILGHSKTIYPVARIDEPSKLEIDEAVVGICEYDGDSFFVLGMSRGTDARKRYAAYRVPFSSHRPVHMKSFESYALISSVFCSGGRIGFVVPNAVHILDEEMREDKYPLGAVVYGCEGMRSGIVAIQDSWSSIRLQLPPSVFKEKFSNK